MKPVTLTSGFLMLVAAFFIQLVSAAPVTKGQKLKAKTPAKIAAKPASKPQNAKMTIANFEIPAFTRIGTPGQIRYRSRRKREPVYLPKGAQIVSRGKPVTSSDDFPIIGRLSVITDGVREGTEGSWVELGPGLQWVQIDMGKPTTLYGVLLWHYHGDERVYRDVIVQVSNDRDFVMGVTTVFNNDQDNSSGLGFARDNEYYEHYQGEWIALKQPQKARYLRLYSSGNTSDPQNQYIEAEVWGDPSK